MQLRNEYRVGNVTRVRSGAIILLAALVSACGSSDEVAPVEVKQVKREQVQAPQDPTAKMARAVTVGKSNVPVNLKYEILNKPVTGSPVEIELAVIPTFGADSLTLTFVGSTGLTLSADAAPPIEVVKAAQVERVKLAVQATEESVYYVTVTATVYTAGSSSVRNFAIPVIMSAPVAASESAAPAPAVKKS
jgi:hypothetical protein